MTLLTDHKTLVHKIPGMEGERHREKHRRQLYISQHEADFKHAFKLFKICVRNFIFNHTSSNLFGNLLGQWSKQWCLVIHYLTAHTQKPWITEKSCRFSKWCHTAWATLSWNSTAGRRGVSRTEDRKQFTLSKKTEEYRQWYMDGGAVIGNRREMRNINGMVILQISK